MSGKYNDANSRSDSSSTEMEEDSTAAKLVVVQAMEVT